MLAELSIECWGGERRCFEIKAAGWIHVTFRAPLELVSTKLKRQTVGHSNNLQGRQKATGPLSGSLTLFSWTDTQLVSFIAAWIVQCAMDR